MSHGDNGKKVMIKAQAVFKVDIQWDCASTRDLKARGFITHLRGH